jgi:hypothetical protein
MYTHTGRSGNVSSTEFACINVCLYVCICTHTHTHTRTGRSGDVSSTEFAVVKAQVSQLLSVVDKLTKTITTLEQDKGVR